MRKIECKFCDNRNRPPGAPSTGCYHCGGYGVLIQELQLTCGCHVWVRPGPFTTYNGKVKTSWDGVEYTHYYLYREDGTLGEGTTICSECAAKREGDE